MDGPGFGRVPVVIDLRDPRVWVDPHAVLQAARAAGRTAVTHTGEVVLLSADDIETVLADPRFVTLGLEALERLGIRDGPFHEWRGRTLNVRNGDDHTRLRSYIGRVFTPRQVERMRPIVAEHAGLLLGRIVAREGGVAPRAGGVTFDLVADFADDLPLVAI